MNKIKISLASLIIVFGVAIDQWSKNLIYKSALAGEIPLKVTSFFDLIAVFNTGVSFSFLSSNNPKMHLVLAGTAILISFVLLYFLVKEKPFIAKLGLAFIIAGALGNSLDRLQHGAVLDFLYFHYHSWSFPAFNGADIFINIGVVIILAYFFLLNSKTSKSKSLE